MEEAYSNADGTRLCVLRESLKKKFQAVQTGDLLEQEVNHKENQEQEVTDFEQVQVSTETRKMSNTSVTELNRIFVVVMDYDPHSLCITGQPELELTVQSG